MLAQNYSTEECVVFLIYSLGDGAGLVDRDNMADCVLVTEETGKLTFTISF